MRRLLAGVLACAPLMAGAAPVLDVSAGQLLGASGVDVGGTLYDVRFVDGSCAALFNGCDEVSDFTFTTMTSAHAAAQALLDEVFLDGSLGDFDTVPSLINGCTASDHCSPLTPYELSSSGTGFSGASARNAVSESGDVVADPLFSAALDLSDPVNGASARVTFALWTLSATTPPTGVPEPPTAAPLGPGLRPLA
ncbi:MAG: hypothetical protein KDC48_20835, partial [Planctomycetes bacterium]|nr:hypothetical protein [Planctomycetota bacterium]